MRTPIRSLLCSVLTLVLLSLPSAGALAGQSNSPVDVRIWTETAAGQPVFDICYTLVGYSNLGCDENRDGNVLFEDIPPGRYDVEATAPNGSDYSVARFTINVDASNTDHMALATPSSSSAPVPGGTTDLLLITRDPQTGTSLTDVCYQLVGYSKIGCDDNKDGRVQFADIPFSSLYTIRQTTAPAGYTPMDDYAISVMPTDLDQPLTILLAQSRSQAPEGKINVAVSFYDTATGAPVQGEENCAQLWVGPEPVSNKGCDEDIVDGQVDFMQVEFDPNGEHASLAVEPMCGYKAASGADYRLLWVGQQTAILYVGLEATNTTCP